MPGRKREPSFQLASGTTIERDNSYNISNTLGSIFYNTDTSNVEIRHEDPSNTLGWRDLVMNNKEQIDISGNLNLNIGRKEVLLAGAGALNGTGGAQGIATGIATAPDTDADYSSHNAFNGTLTDIDDVWHTDGTPLGIDNPKSLIFEFPYDVIITKYKIWPRTIQPHNPKAWTLRAYPAGPYDRMYPPTRNFTSGTKTISGQAYGNGEYVVAQSEIYGSYAGWKAFNGIDGVGVHFNNRYTSSTGSYSSTNRYLVTGYYGDWLTIKLPDQINLTKYGFKQRAGSTGLNARAPGQYKIYGSNDGSNWTAVLVHKTSTITYGGVVGGAVEDFEESISTTGMYKHFGLVVNQLYDTGQTELNFEEWYIYGNEYIPVEIDDVSGVTNWPTPTPDSITNDTSFNEYPVSNTTTAYRKFELNITESSSSAYVTIGQLAFYVYKHSGNLVVNGDVDVEGKLRRRGTMVSPVVGQISVFAGGSTPTGWLQCDGSSISRSAYSELFDVIGEYYGTPVGTDSYVSNYFNIPDLRDRFICGPPVDDPGKRGFRAAQWKGVTIRSRQINGYSHDGYYPPNTNNNGNVFMGKWQTPASVLQLQWDTNKIFPDNVVLMVCIKY